MTLSSSVPQEFPCCREILVWYTSWNTSLAKLNHTKKNTGFVVDYTCTYCVVSSDMVVYIHSSAHSTRVPTCKEHLNVSSLLQKNLEYLKKIFACVHYNRKKHVHMIKYNILVLPTFGHVQKCGCNNKFLCVPVMEK